MTNAKKALIYCRLIEMLKKNKGIVDFETFCVRHAITLPFLFKEVMLSNSFIKDMCESVGTFDDKGKFSAYYGLTLKDALFVLETYQTSELVIKL